MYTPAQFLYDVAMRKEIPRGTIFTSSLSPKNQIVVISIGSEGLINFAVEDVDDTLQVTLVASNRTI